MSATLEKKPRKERTENAERRRRQLLDAARRSILANGLAKTTLATVAQEAGLSQGVAVFYFKSKGGLLAETLRDLYQSYEDHWMKALTRPGTPAAKLAALINADFHKAACGPDVLPLWFAFWGELRAQPQYDEIADSFDARRRVALVQVWQEALPNLDAEEAARLADWMETLSDGYWQHLHIAPGSESRAAACAATKEALVRLAPDLANAPGWT